MPRLLRQPLLSGFAARFAAAGGLLLCALLVTHSSDANENGIYPLPHTLSAPGNLQTVSAPPGPPRQPIRPPVRNNFYRSDYPQGVSIATRSPLQYGNTVNYQRPIDSRGQPETIEMLPPTIETWEPDQWSADQPLATPLSPEDLQSDCCDSCWTWQILPKGLVFRSYLAGAKESRFRLIDSRETELNDMWDVTLGGRVGIFRYGTSGDVRPQGFQVDIEGAGQPRLDPDASMDVDSADFRFGIPITYGNEVHQVKFGYYHLSSHLGDEFLLKNFGYPRLNYSRDVLVLGYSFYYCPELRFYAEAGWAFQSDVAEPWEFQFGIDYSPADRTGIRGAPFVAVNGAIRQELDYSGNFVFQCGWAWRRSPASGLFRLGYEFFRGHSDQFSFPFDHETKSGFGIWYDY